MTFLPYLTQRRLSQVASSGVVLVVACADGVLRVLAVDLASAGQHADLATLIQVGPYNNLLEIIAYHFGNWS